MILDELDPEIRRNFESQGWLPLLDISHPPPTVLFRKFYSNLSVHSTSSNIQFVKSWIRGEEYVITPQVVVSVFVYLWYNSLSILMMKTLHLMRSCFTLPVRPFDGVPILVPLLMSLQSSTIYFFGLPVIPFGPSLICTLFLLRDVHFCMPL